jgi:hypothetical protein
MEWDDFIFSLTKEDIEDYLLNLTDSGIEIDISQLYVDDEYREIFSIGDSFTKRTKNIISGLKNNLIHGAYIIKLNNNKKLLELDEDDTKRYNNGIKSLNLHRLVLGEMSQLSKRVEYLDWQFITSGIFHPNDDWIEIFLVCPKHDIDKEKFDKFIKEENDKMVKTEISERVNKAEDKITNSLTPVFNKRYVSWWKNEKGRFYRFYGGVNKQIITTNKNKILNVDEILPD